MITRVVIGLATEMLLLEEVRRALRERGAAWTEEACTEAERATCFARADPAPGLAARLAAKRATAQALGEPDLDLREIEIVPNASGRPFLALHGSAKSAADRLGAAAFHVTLTHAEHHALAVVLLEGSDP